MSKTQHHEAKPKPPKQPKPQKQNPNRKTVDHKECNKGLTYHDRDTNLAQLGYKTYGKYLKSDLWKSIRFRVMTSANCALCKGIPTETHHTRYLKADLLGTDLTHLHAICHKCHDEIEFAEDGEKRMMWQSIEEFNTKAKRK